MHVSIAGAGQLSSSFIHGITVWGNYSFLLDGSEFLLSSQGWFAVTRVFNSASSSTLLSSVLELVSTWSSLLSSALQKMSPLSGECSVRPHELHTASLFSRDECKSFLEVLKGQCVSLWTLWMRILQTLFLLFCKANISILTLLSYLMHKYSYYWEDPNNVSKDIYFHTYATPTSII